MAMTSCAKQARSIKPARKEDANLFCPVWLDLGEKRLCMIMSAILNYLRYKAACDNDFRNMKSKLVSELKYAKILSGELYFCDSKFTVWQG